MNKSMMAMASLTLALVGMPVAATVAASRPLTAKEDAAQLIADKAALNRQVKRLEADEARLRADTAAGRMSAESKDALAVYRLTEAIKGERNDISKDPMASLQMKADKEALQRMMKRLDLAQKRLKNDAAAGRMAAMSPDSERVYKDRQAVASEKKQIGSDEAKVTADVS